MRADAPLTHGCAGAAAGVERADELHAALVARNGELEAAGYQAQVAVGAQSSLLFFIDEKTGAPGDEANCAERSGTAWIVAGGAA